MKEETISSASDREKAYFKLGNQLLSIGLTQINDGTEWLALDPDTGVVSVKTKIDREKDCGDDDSIKCVVKATVSFYILL